MRSLLTAALDRAPLASVVPPRRRRVVHLLVFGYAAVWLTVRTPYVLDTARLPARRFEPIGVWYWLDEPLAFGIVAALLATTLVAVFVATAGRWPRISAPLGAVGTLAVVTYTNCWGQVFHTENLLVLHLLVLAAAALLARPTEGWPLQLMAVLTVMTYLLAGWAKLDLAGADWLSGDVLRNQVAYDNLRKIRLGDIHSPIGGWLVGIDAVWVPVGVITLLVELGAPLALLGGRIRTTWVAVVWGFHVIILATMAILFPYPLTGVAFVSLFAAERLAGLWASWRRPRRTAQPALP